MLPSPGLSVPAPARERPLVTPPGALSGLCARLALWLVDALPARAQQHLAQLLAALAWHLRIRRRVTLDNLRHAFPERPEAERRCLARQAYGHLLRTVLEALTPGHAAPAQLAARLRLPDMRPLDAAVRAGRGVLLVSAHLGSWELLASVLTQRGYPVAAVVKPLKGALNARLMEQRVAAGLTLLPARGALFSTLSALGRGQMVAMLLDQTLPARHGVFVPFFGRPACTNPALSLAALRSGAPVFVLVAVREGDALRLVLEGPLPPPRTGRLAEDVHAHAARLTQVIEGLIRRYPEQWMWAHRRWKVQPPPPDAPPA